MKVKHLAKISFVKRKRKEWKRTKYYTSKDSSKCMLIIKDPWRKEECSRNQDRMT